MIKNQPIYVIGFPFRSILVSRSAVYLIMANCRGCAAPLPTNNPRCEYCGVYNDIDLSGGFSYRELSQNQTRFCPHCEIPLSAFKLALTPPLTIDRCRQCFGLFFDLNELARILAEAVTQPQPINRIALDNIAKARFRTGQTGKYVRCPVCRAFMGRSNYGYKSGVVIDRCAAHGIWLDAGELRHLLEWKSAGGEMLMQQRSAPAKINSSSARASRPVIKRSGLLAKLAELFDFQ